MADTFVRSFNCTRFVKGDWKEDFIAAVKRMIIVFDILVLSMHSFIETMSIDIIYSYLTSTFYIDKSFVDDTSNRTYTNKLPVQDDRLLAYTSENQLADRQTDRQKDRQTDRQTDRQKDIHTYRQRGIIALLLFLQLNAFDKELWPLKN